MTCSLRYDVGEEHAFFVFAKEIRQNKILKRTIPLMHANMLKNFQGCVL